MDIQDIKDNFEEENKSVACMPLYFSDAVEWMIGEIERLEAAQTIYKIRCIVQEHKRSGKFVDVYRMDEKVIIGNLDHARAVYKDQLNNATTYTQYSKYSAIVELFIPHRHENGELAYWPDNERYIEQFRSKPR